MERESTAFELTLRSAWGLSSPGKQVGKSRGVSKGGLRGLEHPPDQMEKFFLSIIYMGMLPDRVKQERWISKLTCALIQVSAQLEKKLVFTLADSIQPF